jgi:hypothetical protein
MKTRLIILFILLVGCKDRAQIKEIQSKQDKNEQLMKMGEIIIERMLKQNEKIGFNLQNGYPYTDQDKENILNFTKTCRHVAEINEKLAEENLNYEWLEIACSNIKLARNKELLQSLKEKNLNLEIEMIDLGGGLTAEVFFAKCLLNLKE